MSRRLVLLLLFILLSTLLTVTSVRFFVPEPSVENVSQEQRLVGTGLFKTLGEMYLDSLQADPHSIEYHQKMQLLYPSIDPDIQRKVNSFYDSIATFYQFESEYLYSIGFRYSKEGYHDSAAFYYAQIEEEEEELSYLSHSRGFAYLKLGEYEKAEAYLKQAIKSGPSSNGVYVHLAKLYHLTKQYDKLDTLIAQEGMSEIIPTDIQRICYLKRRDYPSYFHSFIEMNFFGFIWEGIVAAALIAMVWLGFLNRVSLFGKQKFSVMATFFILAALFSTLCTLLYDFYNIGFGVEISGNYVKDFFFCVFGIGLVEESLKLAPLFFLILFFRKSYTEPITLLILGSTSAVGFAFMENLIYFDIYGLKSIFGRTLTSSVLHMGLTALPVYGMQKALQLKKRGVATAFVRYFTLAVLLHGLYDFFLSADKALSDFKILAIVIWLLLLFLYRSMIQNLLNLSPHFDPTKGPRLRQAGYYLGYTLYSIFLMQFVFLANRFGSSVTIVTLPGSIMVYSYLLLLVPLLFGTMGLYKNYAPSLFMLGKRNKPPRECNNSMKKKYTEQWRQFQSEHKRGVLRSRNSIRKATKGMALTLVSGVLAVSVLYLVFCRYIPSYWWSISLLFGWIAIYGIRLMVKRLFWSVAIDMSKGTITLYFNRKQQKKISLADVYYIHCYGQYKELLLFDTRLLLDRTLFEDFEIETFFLYFESYVISRENDPVEFHVPEEEVQEFAIPTVLYQKSIESVTGENSS